MKKISYGRVLVVHAQDRKGNPIIGQTSSTLREVNKLLDQVNLKIQFEDSHFHNDDLTAKDLDEVKKQKRGTNVFEPDTLITLHEIEDSFEYIKRTEDIKKLRSIIEKHEEDKIKIDETIKHISSRFKKKISDQG